MRDTTNELIELKSKIIKLDKITYDEHDKAEKEAPTQHFLSFCFNISELGFTGVLIHLILNTSISHIFYKSMNLTIFHACIIFALLIFFLTIPSQLYLSKKEKTRAEKCEKCYEYFHTLKNELKLLNDEYSKKLLRFDSTKYSQMTMYEVSTLPNIEKKVMEDYKNRVLNSNDGKLYTTFNTNNESVQILENI